MQEDLTDAVKWAIKNKIALAEKVAIYGSRYAGTLKGQFIFS